MKRVHWLVVIVAAVTLFFSCESYEMKKWRAPQEFLHQEDAGSAHVAVLSVATFDEYKAALQPTFKLTEDQALASSLATTQVSEDRLLDALQVAAKLSLPTSGTTATKTNSTTDGTTTASTSETTSKAPGDVSSITSPTPTVTATPTGKSLVDTALGTDPTLRYWAATALYQEAALLSRYVKDAAVGNNYTPYVVRLQISLMPFARNEPYDAYTSVSFFEGETLPGSLFVASNAADTGSLSSTLVSVLFSLPPDKQKEAMRDFVNAPAEKKQEVVDRYTQTAEESEESGEAQKLTQIGEPSQPQRAIAVVPLLVTDNLESSAQSATLDRIRQQAFSLAFLMQGIAGQADFVKYSRRLESVFGRDYNSLMTVARVTDNTYRVRLGALQQVGTSLAMVPRTNQATFLLLVPKSKPSARISLTAQTTFVNAKTGQALDRRSSDDVKKRLDDIGDRYCRLYDLSYTVLYKSQIEGTVSRCQGGPILPVNLLDLQGLVQRDRFDEFKKTLTASFLANNVTREFPAQSLWVDLASVMVGGQYASTSFELPNPKSPSMFCDQHGIVTDDGKKQATVTLRGGRDLTADKLAAVLVTDANAGMRLYSTGIQVRPGGSEVEFAFPSPKSLDKKFTGSPHAKVEVICPDCGDPSSRCGPARKLPGGAAYDATVTLPTEDKKSVFQATAYSDAISLDREKRGAIQIKIDLTDAAMAEAADTVLKKPRTISIEVTGANVFEVAGAALPVKPQNLFEFATDRRVDLRIVLDALVAQNVVTVKIQEKVEAESPKPSLEKVPPPKPTYLPISEFHYSFVPEP